MKRWKSYQAILPIVAVLVMTTLALPPVPVLGQNDGLTAKVVTNPTDLSSLQAGQAFQLYVELEGSGNGYGYSALILFDADRLDVNLVSVAGQPNPVPVSPGPLFGIPPNGQNTMFARNDVVLDDPARADETLNDAIEVAFTYLAPAEPTTTLTGTLLTITFTAKEAQPTSVVLADLRVVQRSAENLAVDIPITFEGELALAVNGGAPVAMATCNLNNICDNALGENSVNCPEDCEAIAPLTDITPPALSAPETTSSAEEDDDNNQPIVIALVIAVGFLVALLIAAAALLLRGKK